MEILVFSLTILAFILASYEDIKKKEIYDYLNFAFVFFILTIAIIDSILTASFDPIKYAGFGMLIGFVLGSLLYFSGVWGGGDAKFLIGFSAASFYIFPYSTTLISQEILNYVFTTITTSLQTILQQISLILIIINSIAILYICYFLLKKNHIQIVKNAFYQLLALILFTGGLLFTQYPLLILILGILAFIIIFFADEYMFYSVFYLKKKHLTQLKLKDIPNTPLSKKMPLNHTMYGLSQTQLNEITKLKDKEITIRKILPTSLLIALNFIIYIGLILSIDTMNLEIIWFLLKMLFASFIAGGIMVVTMMGYYCIKNYKKVLQIFSSTEQYLFFLLVGIIIIGAFISTIILYLGLLAFLYYFIKTAKNLEEEMFVKKRSLNNIALGDWIVQDICVGNNLYFTKDDFKLGVDEYQLNTIKKLAKKHKQFQELTIKDGIAFLPPLFIGFIIVMII